MERRFEKGHLPGGLDPSLAPTLWRVLGDVSVDFVAKAWLDRTEGWLVVTPDELAFISRYRQLPLRVPLEDIQATKVKTHHRLRDFLRAPQLIVQRRNAEPLIFEMVHYDVAWAAIQEVHKEKTQR